MVVDLAEVITEVDGQVHEEVGCPQASLPDQEWIRCFELCRPDAIERAVEIGNS
jgi:hypothetical protein